MKIGRLVLEVLRIKVERDNARTNAHLVIVDKYRPTLDVPYINDKKDLHKFDAFHSPVKRKKCLIIDIHGGAYMFGHRRENYTFGTYFLDHGFDFIATDYIPNNGKSTTRELIDQNIKCIVYILNHLKELGYEKDIKIALTGDSAGGHMALTIAELFSDKEYQKELGYDLPKMNLVAVLLNCPVFNYVNVGLDSMTKGGNKRMFGPNAMDIEERKKICPRTHINSLKAPLFASTCKNDFIRSSESLKLKETMAKRDHEFEFIDLDTDDHRVGHVHNILDINHEASQHVNDKMMAFIEKYL